MLKRRMCLILCVVLIISLFAIGCTGLGQEKGQANVKTGLQIYSMSTGLGSVSNNTDLHRLTYTINLSNENTVEAFIQWIEPVLGVGIKDKLLTEDLKVVVEKAIPSKGSLEIKGEVVFDTKGLSKQEIVELEPFITGIKVVNDEIIIINT